MNPTILNREFKHPADGWYHIEPKGNHLNRRAQVEQVIDDTAISAIVNRFNADAEAGKLSHGIEMLIDHEHFKHDTSKETIAYGWLQALQNRADGIYGRIRWTSVGQAAVDGGNYRFFSTEYAPEDLEILNRGKITQARPLRLDGLTLTNDPNNRGARPITNRILPDDPANSPAGGQADTKKKTIMKLIAQKLGLSADASEESILGAIAKIENRATTAEQALQPVTTERDTLKNRLDTFLGEQADEDLKAHGITDPEEQKAIKPMLLTNRAGTLAILAPRKVERKEVAKPVFNRTGAKTPDSNGLSQEGNDEAEKKIASRISNRARELQAANPSRRWAECWDQAEGEIESK